MKKYTLLLFLLFTMCGLISAQLVNNGGTITIQNGATLIVEGDVTHSSGTIVNNGTLEVTGNMTSDGTFTSGAASKLITSGDQSTTLDMNGATVAILENSKTAGDVTLLSAVTVNEEVDFSGSSDYILSDFDLTLEDGVTTNGSTSGHFVTNGIGKLVQVAPSAGSATADVGDGTNYSPITYSHSGTYTASSTVSTSVTNTAHPDKLSDADDFLNRYWEMTTDITNPSIDMTGTYVAGDVSGTDTDMVGARWENTDWEFSTGSQSGSTVSATSTETTSELTGMNFFGKANVKVLLDGPYDDATQTMSTTLNTLDLIPNTSPFVDGKTVDAAFWNDSNNDDIVDWVYVETRDASGTVTGGTSAFLESDGDVVSVEDGTSLPSIKDAGANSHIVVKHRNHLPISTPVVDITTEALNDLSLSSETAFGTNSRKLYSGTGKATMWPGDAGDNESIRLLGADNDSDFIRNAVLNDPGNFFNFLTYTIQDTYSDYDVNLDGDVRLLGSSNDNDILRNTILEHPGNFFNFLTFTITNTLP